MYLGRTNFSNLFENNFVTRGASSVSIHPDWDPHSEKYDADIAVVHLNSKVIFTRFINAICLPTPTQNVFEVFGTVVGYGVTENSVKKVPERSPKFLTIKSVTQEDCIFSHESLRRISSKRTFCAGEPGKIPCE